MIRSTLTFLKITSGSLSRLTAPAVIAMLQCNAIIGSAVSKPFRFLADSSHLLEEWSPYSMALVMDTLEQFMERAATDGRVLPNANVNIFEAFEKQQGSDSSGRSPFAQQSSHKRSSIHQALTLRSPIISEIFPTAKERAARAAEEFADGSLHGATLSANALGWEGSGRSTHGVPLRATSRDTHGAVARRDENVPPPPHRLEGEEAMEALVQETSASFAAMTAAS